MSYEMKKVYPERSRRAFTLIELLVVIAIIGILATMVTFSVTGAKEKARDATRKSDLHLIKAGLEVFYSDQNPNSYPLYHTATTISESIFLVGGATSQSYIKNVPTDPTEGRNYLYISDADDQNYVLSADLENDSDVERGSSPEGYTIDGDYFVEND